MFSNQKILDEIKEYKYRIELHAHSNPASGCADFPAEEVVRTYSGLGFDALVLTNHYYAAALWDGEDANGYFERYFGDYHRACEEAEKCGIKVILGFEFRFADKSNDYLVFGISEEEAKEIFPHLSGTIEDFRKNYHNPDMVLIHAHPFRNNTAETDPNLLDGVEILNLHPNHNSRVGYCAQLARKVDGIVTAGSDFHHANMAGLGGIFTREMPEDTKALARILKSGDYLVDFGGFPVIPQIVR